MAPVTRCVACGADLSGRYCPGCGEAAGHHDYSLKHFAEEALETLAHVDGRVFSTFRSLVTQPGLLASAAVLTAYRFVLFFTSFYAT